MAQRRMFAKTIISSDAFLELSARSQVLYIQLNMAADDDGVVNNAKSVMATINATKKEYNELLNSKFIIELDNLTIIKHWRINNYIQSDRRKPSNYKETLAKLEIDNNNAYSLHQKMDTESIQNVYKNGYKMDTQDSIVKNSKEKNNNLYIENNNDPLILFREINKNRKIENTEYLELVNLIRVHGKEKIKEILIQIKDNLESLSLNELKERL